MSPQPSKISRDELISYVRSYSSRIMPGLLSILDRIFITKFNDDIISLFLSDPKKVYMTLLDLYGNEDTVVLIMNYLLIKPVLVKLNRLDLIDKAITLAMKNPEEFKELLRSLNVDL